MKQYLLGRFQFFLTVIGLLVVFGAFSVVTYGQTNDDKLPGTLWSGRIDIDAKTELVIVFKFGKGKEVSITIADSRTKTVEEYDGTYTRNKDAVTMKFPKIIIEKAEVWQECIDDDTCDRANLDGMITLKSGSKHRFRTTKSPK